MKKHQLFEQVTGHDVIDNLKYELEVTDSYKGEVFGFLVLYNLDIQKKVGYVDWSSFGNEVWIQMIEVYPEYKRYGCATKMIEYLKQYFSDKKLTFSSSTEEGDKFIKSLKEDTIPKRIYRGVGATLNKTYEKHGYIVSKFHDFLRAENWHFVDSGYFSEVFTKEGSPYILKVNIKPDYAFDFFVKYVHKISSPYLPKIIDRKFAISNNRTYFLYFIEKLQNCPPALSLEIDEFFKEIIMNPLVKQSGDEYFNEKYPEMSKYKGFIEMLIKVNNDVPKISGYISDFSSSNVMWRSSENVPVIMDPWAAL